MTLWYSTRWSCFTLSEFLFLFPANIVTHTHSSQAVGPVRSPGMGWNRNRATNRANHRAVPTWVGGCSAVPIRSLLVPLNIRLYDPVRAFFAKCPLVQSFPGPRHQDHVQGFPRASICQHETLWIGAGFPCCTKSALVRGMTV